MAASPATDVQKSRKGRPAKRFRINPVELVIFSLISLVFLNSVYHLFYDWQGFKPATLTMLEATEPADGERRPAQANPSFMNLEYKCQDVSEHRTSAAKLRLNGPLCRAPEDRASAQERQPATSGTGGMASETAKLIRTEITNTTNNATATVFTDVQAAKFSTDYIPLESGPNSLSVRFVYQGGRTVSQSLTVVRENS